MLVDACCCLCALFGFGQCVWLLLFYFRLPLLDPLSVAASFDWLSQRRRGQLVDQLSSQSTVVPRGFQHARNGHCEVGWNLDSAKRISK